MFLTITGGSYIQKFQCKLINLKHYTSDLIYQTVVFNIQKERKKVRKKKTKERMKERKKVLKNMLLVLRHAYVYIDMLSKISG